MQDHAIPDTEADDPIELYLPLVEEELFWPEAAEMDAEEELPQQQQLESYSAFEAVDNHFPVNLDEANAYLPLVETAQSQNQHLESIVNECVRAIDELCTFSDQLKLKIDALEKIMTDAEKNFKEEKDE